MLGADEVPMVLYGDAASEWFKPVGSYSADLMSMCMLCQILQPKVVLEIGTYHGSGALHWAGNAPNAHVYTLDLPEETAPMLALTSMDRQHVAEHSARKVCYSMGGRRPKESRAFTATVLVLTSRPFSVPSTCFSLMERTVTNMFGTIHFAQYNAANRGVLLRGMIMDVPDSMEYLGGFTSLQAKAMRSIASLADR
jgi:hypothetical protein